MLFGGIPYASAIFIVKMNVVVSLLCLQHYPGDTRPLWFVFSGMGSQWNGMGTELMEIPIFAATIEKLQAVLKPKGVDVKRIITDTNPKMFDNILNSFVGIAAIQVKISFTIVELFKKKKPNNRSHTIYIGLLECEKSVSYS